MESQNNNCKLTCLIILVRFTRVCINLSKLFYYPRRKYRLAFVYYYNFFHDHHYIRIISVHKGMVQSSQLRHIAVAVRGRISNFTLSQVDWAFLRAHAFQHTLISVTNKVHATRYSGIQTLVDWVCFVWTRNEKWDPIDHSPIIVSYSYPMIWCDYDCL